MSAEDETFDIDLYGDDPEDDELPQYQAIAGNPQTHTDNITSSNDTIQTSDTAPVTSDRPVKALDAAHTSLNSTLSPLDVAHASSNAPGTQGVKRKAPTDEHDHDDSQQHDERPLDHGAQISLKLTDLQWWTTEEDLRYFCAQSHTEAELVEVAFGEHKQNGKSKGEAYLEFKTPQAAGMAKREIEEANAKLDAGSKANVTGKTKISVWYTAPGNPFRVRDGQSKKDIPSKYGQQGAYNNHNRGGYAGRGRGGYNARGGGQWSNQTNSNNSNNTFNNAMPGGYNNMGFAGFPAMAMNQSTMMNNMMGMMGMGMQGMMNARGGANMMNRGGWNNGQGYQQAGYDAGWDSSKKARKE
ncbi:hypothetical protein AMS68_004748 [Peltaster fructicola]|uniref:RRM domain-containing protein n=1 Tax=Peltaster fructicola TaxID=286661 RepID=A0A6H0XX45_9PEZI|nr:hypothetical protein AMS68_004748 [Peltaster fructicola]